MAAEGRHKFPSKIGRRAREPGRVWSGREHNPRSRERKDDGAHHRSIVASLHDTVLKRYRVAAGSARTIHDYLRPPRLPSLPRFFHPSRLFSLRDPSYTHDSAIEIATGIAPHDSAMEIATGIAPASSRTRRPKLHSPPLNFPLIRHSTSHSSATQHSPPPVKSPVKILVDRTERVSVEGLDLLCWRSLILPRCLSRLFDALDALLVCGGRGNQ